LVGEFTVKNLVEHAHIDFDNITIGISQTRTIARIKIVSRSKFTLVEQHIFFTGNIKMLTRQPLVKLFYYIKA